MSLPFKNGNWTDGLSDMHRRLQQARNYYEDEQHSDVSVVILHMSELLSSFVHGDTPENRAVWSRALSDVRNVMATHHPHEELKFITDFSIMLEEGLQCLASKCAKLEQAVRNAPPREHDYVIGNSPLMPLSPIDGAFMKMPKRLYGFKNQLVACDFCKGKTFARPRYLNHLRRVHPEQFEKIAKYRCDFCKSALFISKKALQAHLDTCQSRIEHNWIVRRMPTAEEMFCRMCKMSCQLFATLEDLAAHSDKEHPHIQILSCTGCGQLFKRPEQLVDHWKNLSQNSNSRSKCALGAPAALVSRSKLINQLFVHYKAVRGDKNFAFIECMTQDIQCQVCGVVCDSFLKLYHHTHRDHNKIAQSELIYGCLGCNNKYKCVPSIKDHLMKSEIGEYEACRNAGVVYWGEILISKDLRPKEAIEMEAKREEAEREEMRVILIKKEVMEKEKDEEMKEKEEEKIVIKTEPMEEKEEKNVIMIKNEVMERDEEMEMEIERAPFEQSMEMDAGFNGMPPLEHCG